MITEAQCPHCGSPVTFQVGSSLVVVCGSCRTVVARTDRSVEDLGRVAAILGTGSQLKVGSTGRFRGMGFRIVGRVQFNHWAGGLWDEWYAAFGDGRWGWLAEAQGRFFLTFEQASSAGHPLPSYANLKIGAVLSQLEGAQAEYVVAEKGKARVAAAEGEIPWRPISGQPHSYADLYGGESKFATLDYDDPTPTVFLGAETRLDEIGMLPDPAREAHRTVSAEALSCPRCGAPLSLRVPDLSERVTCPSCGSLLDVREGKLQYFKSLQHKYEPRIPIGSRGVLRGISFTVVGFLRRHGKEDPSAWNEYLLYNPQAGFRWLVESDDHWTLVAPVSPGDVRVTPPTATFRSQNYRLYAEDQASVEFVMGEFYWKVEIGETVQTSDFIRPPEILTREITSDGDDAEVNFSLGTYLPAREVEKMFGLTDLGSPATVAPNQPFPMGDVGPAWLGLAVLALAVGVVLAGILPRRTILSTDISVDAATREQDPHVFVSDPFTLNAHQNVFVRTDTNVENSWADLEGGLINLKTGLVQPISLPTEYYWGYDGGEHWTEGSRRRQVYLSALPPGEYSLRLEIQLEPNKGPALVSLVVGQGMPHWLHLWVLLGVLSIFPLLIGIWRFSFEKRRWEGSNFSPFKQRSSSE